MADPNWLLSTAAQSAAAIVAIIGGFLATRIVTFGVERREASRRVSELDLDLEVARARLEEKSATLEDWSARDYFAKAVPHILGGGALTLRDLLEAQPLTERIGDDALPTYFDRAVSAISAARHRFAPAMKTAELPPETYGEYLQNHPEDHTLDMFRLGIDAAVYHALSAERRGAVRAGSAVEEPLVRGFEHYLKKLKEELRDEVGDLREAISKLDAARTRAVLLSRRITSPPGMRLGFAVLLAFAVLGIGVPMALLPAGPESTATVRAVVLPAFGAGLVGVLAYIGWLVFAETASRDSDDE